MLVGEPIGIEANAISSPPGKYGRKVETQNGDGGPHRGGGACGLIPMQREEPYLPLTSCNFEEI